MYAEVDAELLEVACKELASTVSTQCAHWFASLPFRRGLDALDRRGRAILAGEQRDPHVSRVIIDQEQEVPITARSRWRDGAAEVAVE